MLKAIILGSGGAWPDPNREPPAHVIVVDGTALLFDCGGGTTNRLAKVGIKPSEMEYIFISHLHIDHCVELPNLIFSSYLTGKKSPWNIYGPDPMERFIKLMFDDVFWFSRTMLKKLRDIDLDVHVEEISSGVVMTTKSWTVTAAPVNHEDIPTYAYRVDTSQGSIVYSADTEPCESLSRLAKDADLLIQDCAWPDNMGVGPSHCIPEQVREIVTTANVKRVALEHMFPPC